MKVLQYKQHLASELSKNSGSNSEISGLKAVGGGCINSAFEFSFGDRNYFLKENNSLEFPAMFKKESSGLKELAKGPLVVPQPVLELTIEDTQFIIMEFLQRIPTDNSYSEKLGTGLAMQHKRSSSHFGFEEDNYIGSLPQVNTKQRSWEEFFSQQRLHPLVKWCYDEKILEKKHLSSFENLYSRLNELFPAESPSLLHGDLWSGNAMNTTKGPSVFDPAVYYGHREMDIAMTRLFGGFDQGFYEAYEATFPLEKNYKQRTDICNLYPLLVHVKLFGRGYLADVLQTVKRF